MTIAPWRLALTAGALVILGAIGGGLVVDAATPKSPDTVALVPAATADDTAALLDALALTGDPGSSSGNAVKLAALRDRLQGGLARLRERFVHGTATVLDRDGKLVTHQLDHGTVSALGPGSITIAEAGGTSVVVTTTAETRVRRAKAAASLADLKVGDEVVVRSTVVGGSAIANWVVVPPASPAADARSDGFNG